MPCIKDTDTAHAILSASSAHRWILCPPSARLEAGHSDSGSPYAAEGSLAHAICELKLKKHFGLERLGAKTMAKKLAALKEQPEFAGFYAKEMDGYADDYKDYVAKCAITEFEKKPYVAIEQRVDYSAYAPGGFGTADCILIGEDLIHIVDFKYGKGIAVDATENPQLKLYAIGSIARYSLMFNINRVKLSIFQPRINNVSEFETDVASLLEWGEKVVKPAAKLAIGGMGEFRAGEHCRFCRCRAVCRARAEAMLAIEKYSNKKLEELSANEIGNILTRAVSLSSWVESLKEYAAAAIMQHNREIPGWKMVEGRSIRQFKDVDAAFKAVITSGVNEAMLYERKPITLTAVESLLGKARFADICGAYVEKPPGKPTLVAASDKRPAIYSAEVVFKDVPVNTG